jgi:DNA integrity scanning protein DisA with diadenylate cyclase activity
MEENFRMITFDMKDLYVNIPINVTLSITKALLLEQNNEHTTKEIISLLDIIFQQNYFISQNNIYQPEKGISMGSPISVIVAEIFLQHLENSHLNQILETKNIIFYTRYVDDILIIYDTERTSSETIHNCMNKIHPNLEFTPTQEHNNSISFLDLLINQKPSKIEIDIYRKPTATDTAFN